MTPGLVALDAEPLACAPARRANTMPVRQVDASRRTDQIRVRGRTRAEIQCIHTEPRHINDD